MQPDSYEHNPVDLAYSVDSFNALSQVWQTKLTAHLSALLSAQTDVLHWTPPETLVQRAEELRPIYQLETERVREQAWIGLRNKTRAAAFDPGEGAVRGLQAGHGPVGVTAAGASLQVQAHIAPGPAGLVAE